jgi:hypothetical protein
VSRHADSSIPSGSANAVALGVDVIRSGTQIIQRVRRSYFRELASSFLILGATIVWGQDAARGQPAAPPAPKEPKTEFGIAPLVGGSTDYGVGVGYFASLARFKPAVTPYVWRMESGGFISFKSGDETSGSSWVTPYQDYSIRLTVPHFLHDRLRLDLRPSFTRETTQRYYGLGNASVAPLDDVPSRDFYGRTHPTLSLRLRLDLKRNIFVEVGTAYTENWFTLDPQSTLATDMSGGTPAVRELLGTANRHGVLLTETSLLYDTRDSEVSPHDGQYHQAKLRYSPSLSQHLPYQYAQLNLTTRLYMSLVPERLRFAARVVVDWQFGDVPFYELARYEDTFAFGGANGIRGIPGQRYYGRGKIFSNLELRSRLFDFTFFKKPYIFGSAVFADFGRLWADFTPHPELDGSGLGLKYGLGGGVRLQQGRTFVLRLDLAWSPDARPVGAYLTAGHAF